MDHPTLHIQAKLQDKLSLSQTESLAACEEGKPYSSFGNFASAFGVQSTQVMQTNRAADFRRIQPFS